MTSPGWYPDPGRPGMQRYWDGQAWTPHTAVGAPPPQPGGGRSAGVIVAIVIGVLLAGVVVLGVVSAVVVFAVGNSTDQAQTRACQIERRTLVTALEVYRHEEMSADYPTADDTAAVVAELMSLDLLVPDTEPADIASRWSYEYTGPSTFSLAATEGGVCEGVGG